MAFRASHLLRFFLSSFILLPFLSQATSSRPSERFGSFKHLEGSRKGDKREGIQKVKQYLERYGYLNAVVSHPSTDGRDDEFDDVLESSLKAFQSFYHLSPTGILDSPTAETMSRPRCGFPDHPPSANVIHPDYDFWDEQKWPEGHRHIHYIVYPYPEGDYPEEPFTKGFDTWAAVSNFTFQRVRDERFADVRVRFKFKDGYSGIVASTNPLPNPEITLDNRECWAVGAEPGCFDLQTVATHEIGHILGLGHSGDPKAVMAPFFKTNKILRDLARDDINGIRARYS